MAICKMKHVTILCHQAQKDDILSTLQEYGGVEITQDGGAPALPAEHDAKRTLLDQALHIAGGYRKKPSLADMRTPKPSLSALALKEQVMTSDWELLAVAIAQTDKALSALLQRHETLAAQRSHWIPWQDFTLTNRQRQAPGKYSFLPVSLSPQSVPGFEEALEAQLGDAVLIQTVYTHTAAAGLLLIFPQKYIKTLHALLTRFNASIFEPPENQTVSEALQMLGKEEQALVNQREALLEKQRVHAQRISVLEYAQEYDDNLLLRKAQEPFLLQSPSSIAVTGWLPAGQENGLAATLDTKLPAETFYLAFDDVREDQIEAVPILLKNNRIFRSFETLTEMYSMPMYNETDPTPLVAPFYMLFFGMMVADVGYGLIMLLALGGARLFLKHNEDMLRKTDFFYYLSYPVMLWGFIYGSFFGVDLPFRFISPTEDIVSVVIVSIALGWLHMLCGLVVNALTHFRQKDIWGGLSDGVAWLLFLVGMALVVLSQFVIKVQALFQIGVGMCILAALGIVFIPMISDRSKFKGLAKGLYALYGVSSYVGDLVSYTRLMALGVAGASIALAFNTILGYLPLIVRVTAGLFLAPALHALNMFLALLGAYVHGMRLQFVEFFGKFFSGGGRKFQPFGPSNHHVKIKQEPKQ